MPVTYDPTDPGILRDPHAVFHELRAAGPVHWCDALSGWLVLDHAGVYEVVMTPEVYSANRLVPFSARLPAPERATAAEVLRWLGLWMVFRDPPDHTRIRRHLSKLINPRVVRGLGEPIAAITRDLLDGFAPDQTIDFYSDFALKLPGFVVMDLLGVPRARLDEVKSWSDEMMLFIGSSRRVEDKYERARHGAQSMARLFGELIAARRAEPRDDVLTRLIASEIDGDRLTDDELIASMMMVANGAQETTAHLLSNALLALAADPDAAAALRADPDGLIETAVEEFLRYDSPVLSTARLAVADAELGGTTIAAGDRVFAMLVAANRDPEAFEDPDALDLTRRPNRHLSFSHGAHFCLGAAVARLEAQVALREILTRHPAYEIVEDVAAIPWTNSLVARGPSRLPLRLG